MLRLYTMIGQGESTVHFRYFVKTVFDLDTFQCTISRDFGPALFKGRQVYRIGAFGENQKKKRLQ